MPANRDESGRAPRAHGVHAPLPAVIPDASRLAPGSTADQARAIFSAAGWRTVGSGDWAWVLASPDGSLVARVTPFDPAFRLFADASLRGPSNPYLVRVDELLPLRRRGYVVVMERLHPADENRALRLAAALTVDPEGASSSSGAPTPTLPLTPTSSIFGDVSASSSPRANVTSASGVVWTSGRRTSCRLPTVTSASPIPSSSGGSTSSKPSATAAQTDWGLLPRRPSGFPVYPSLYARSGDGSTPAKGGRPRARRRVTMLDRAVGSHLLAGSRRCRTRRRASESCQHGSVTKVTVRQMTSARFDHWQTTITGGVHGRAGRCWPMATRGSGATRSRRERAVAP